MVDFYKRSKKIFEKKLKENKEMGKEEWERFAHENCLFSANTLMFHANVKSFEKLKEKLS